MVNKPYVLIGMHKYLSKSFKKYVGSPEQFQATAVKVLSKSQLIN